VGWGQDSRALNITNLTYFSDRPKNVPLPFSTDMSFGIQEQHILKFLTLSFSLSRNTKSKTN